MSHYAEAASSGGVPVTQQRRFEHMLRRPENRVCFDCDSRQPRWASTNLGIFFCLRCAGIHRSMGVHISKVKSTNMDVWEPSMIDFIEHVGNARGRMLYEYNMPDSAKVKSYTDSHTAERLLRTKYERKQFYNPQFETVLKQFLATPITDADVAHLAGARAGGVALTAPPSGPVVAPPPAVVMEDMWGAPVVSTVAAAPPTNAAGMAMQPPTTSVNVPRTSVSELFANDTPVGAYPTGPVPIWGSAGASHAAMHTAMSANQLYPQPHQHGDYGAMQRAHTQPPPPSTSSGGGVSGSNFSFLFQDNANAARSGTSSAQPSQPQRAQTDDLMQGGGNSRAAENEILSLFDSAPQVGSGRGHTGAAAQGTGRAWEPQVVRPYYKPEW